MRLAILAATIAICGTGSLPAWSASGAMPIKPGLYAANLTGPGGPDFCAQTKPKEMYRWNGRQFLGEDGGFHVLSFKYLGMYHMTGYAHAGPRYLVQLGGGDGQQRWTLPDHDTVVLNVDPIVWCGANAADVQRRHPFKPAN